MHGMSKPTSLTLVIGNKNYSSWSMRPWVMLAQAGISFQEQMLRFDSFGPQSQFKQAALGITPVGKVPVLIDDGFVIWDTLAIAEYAAEKFPEAKLWPTDAKARARARSVCAEMHSGFTNLRSHCPMNIEADLPHIGAIVLRDQAGVRADLARIVSMWGGLLGEYGGPMLFGDFSIADAYFAPVCWRIRTYGLPVSEPVQAYMQRVFALHAMRRWESEARAECDFVAEDEPYRTQR
jgi:glutathione S-transferase